MKALSIRQPWASMIILGHKPVDNRNWKTSYRGPLYIHASQIWDIKGAEWIITHFPHLKFDVDVSKKGPRGGIIGSVNMVACVPSCYSPWFTGKWGFLFSKPKLMNFRPYPGNLKFFDVPV